MLGRGPLKPKVLAMIPPVPGASKVNCELISTRADGA
jgi:hypothetical protein